MIELPRRPGAHVRFIFSLLLSLCLFFQSLSPTVAQESVPDVAVNQGLPAHSGDINSAPVIIDGETLFIVRGSTVLPAPQRAALIERRILQTAELPEFIELDYEISEGEFGLSVLANGRLLAIATDADAEFEQLDKDILAELYEEAIKTAIVNYRLGRSDEALIESAIVAVGWTLAFVLLTILFGWKRKQLVRWFEQLVIRRFSGFEEATNAMVKGQAVGKLFAFATNLLLWIGYVFVLYYYLTAVALSFTQTRPFAQLLLTYVSQPLMDVIFGIISYLPNVITLAIIYIVTRYLIKGLRLLMDNVEAGTFEWKDFEPHWVKPTFNISRVVIIAIAVVFAYPHIPGSDSRAFQGLTLLAGLMLSLGSNTVVSNMMAGMFVIYRRSTNIGDRIKVGDQVGDVIEIKMMETLIKSVKNEMVSIPNAQLLNSEVVNYSRKIDGRGLLVHTTVGIGYEEPQDKVEAMLIEAANRTRDIKKTPEPFVLWAQLADYAINYQINAFTTRGSSLPRILSDLHRNIVDVFNENGVQIMTPSYEADPDQPKIPAEEWNGELAAKK